MNIDFNELDTLMSTMRTSGIKQLVLKNGTARLVLRGQASRASSTALTYAVQEEQAYDSPEHYYESDADDSVADLTEMIVSPAVGIFHHVKPVVGMNASITEGQLVGHIKTMGLNNEVRSPVTGIVKELLVEDSMPVEYGHPLFEIEVTL